MSIVSFLSCLYFGFMILLMFKRNSIGNLYMVFGLLTLIFIIGYTLVPLVPINIQSFYIFIIFSIMILLFGLMNGTFMKIINKSNKVSQTTSVASTIILILILFNLVGYLEYMYIPVLLYMLQDKLNNRIDKFSKKK